VTRGSEGRLLSVQGFNPSGVKPSIIGVTPNPAEAAEASTTKSALAQTMSNASPAARRVPTAASCSAAPCGGTTSGSGFFRVRAATPEPNQPSGARQRSASSKSRSAPTTIAISSAFCRKAAARESDRRDGLRFLLVDKEHQVVSDIVVQETRCSGGDVEEWKQSRARVDVSAIRPRRRRSRANVCSRNIDLGRFMAANGSGFRFCSTMPHDLIRIWKPMN